MSFEKDGRQIETLVKPDKTNTGKRLRFITVEGTVYILGTVTSQLELCSDTYFSFWAILEQKYAVHVALPKIAHKLDEQSRQRVLRVNCSNIYTVIEGMFDTIRKVHEDIKFHGGRISCYDHLKKQFANLTGEHVQIYINCCQHCQIKNSGGSVKKSVVVKPILSQDYNRRCQVIQRQNHF